MRCVEKRGDFPHHYYLMTKDGLIVDGTWQQFLRPFCPPQYSCIRPPLPDHLPKVFIGTRKELVDLVDGNAQRKFTANGKEISAEEFVDMQYGLGKHAHESHEVGLRFR
jgi:hypothetical protein